jgi:hypothetical protein
MFCPNCQSDLLTHHILEDRDIPPMRNKSRIIHPKCSGCGRPIRRSDVDQSIAGNRKVLLITGTAGAGKTALGQLIESRVHYVFIDGDAVQKCVNHFAKSDPSMKRDYQAATIDTMIIALGLGYDVVVGYIITKETLKLYTSALAEYSLVPTFRVLVPERKICLERDIARDCWTAGEVWVDQWYEEMLSYVTTHRSLCIDSSNETLEETFTKHFIELL